MFKPFRTVAVLGAGVMGTQIAAHLANAGLTVHLLDVASPTNHKNAIVETAFKKALKLSPPIFFTEKTARRVILGNFDEHFDRISQVDWVIEVIIEKLEIKQQLMQRLEDIIADHTIVSTNTSGLPIHAIAQGRSESFRQRFLGTHFFNPPRYLKLLELIPTADTDPAIVEQIKWFGELHLGKGVVLAKDTPNFIGNRIGLFVTMQGLRAWTEQGYTIEEIDALTGTLIGRPKSATFRTADLVGLDTLLYVAENLYPAIPQDESRDRFKVPEVMHRLVATGTLGAKTRQGFYKKQGSEILSLNPVTFGYEAAQPLNLGELEQLSKVPSLRDRIALLYRDPGRAGQFFRQTLWEMLSYSARRIPEIADTPAELDRAMRWGFGWELGPFELWDALGFDMVLHDLKAQGIALPDWLDQIKQFYPLGQTAVPADEIDLNAIKADPSRTVWQNPEAALLDLGDGVLLYEFRSKGNTLSLKVVEGLSEVLDILETRDYKGLVIGNGSAHFSGGANLAEMGMLAQTGNFDAIAKLIVDFQSVLQRIHYASKPVVAAVQGRMLGGGCELVMACPHVVAAAETYIGLVEFGVGLIPGAGGIMRMVTRAVARSTSESLAHLQAVLRPVFETIATARVSTSAYEAQELGFLTYETRILMNGDRRLSVAKAEVLHLHHAGYMPPPESRAVMVLGRPARAMLELTAYVFQQGGFASDYDRYLADRLAYVMTGGDLTAPMLVHEDYLLRLEREMFLPLLAQPKTQERIAHMLKLKKPLRN
jgi:3-hydroxyacyl-CoA dehydrogenase